MPLLDSRMFGRVLKRSRQYKGVLEYAPDAAADGKDGKKGPCGGGGRMSFQPTPPNSKYSWCWASNLRHSERCAAVCSSTCAHANAKKECTHVVLE